MPTDLHFFTLTEAVSAIKNGELSPVDFVEALEKAAISVGVDVVTLGIGKYVGKPIWNTIKTRMMNGEDAGKIVKELSDKTLVAAPDAGTTASKIQTQAIIDSLKQGRLIGLNTKNT